MEVSTVVKILKPYGVGEIALSPIRSSVLSSISYASAWMDPERPL